MKKIIIIVIAVVVFLGTIIGITQINTQESFNSNNQRDSVKVESLNCENENYTLTINNGKYILIKGLSKIAEERGQTLAEMALAWVLKDGVVISVLIGASKPEQILDNIKAIQNTSFSAAELEAIDKLSLT